MKTLRNFVVNGALLQADTGPEAQVGDQVRLYLDTVSQPDFPEYVLGTIQHPIVKVRCNSITSYSIEYDEEDLEGAAASLIPDHVVEATVVTAVSVLDAALQAETAARIAADATEAATRGAADAAETAARIAADAAETAARAAGDTLEAMLAHIAEDPAASRAALADENGNFPVQGIVMEDTAAVALADGVFGWNATLDGYVRHDGTTVGGNLYVPDDPLHIKGNVSIGAAAIAAADVEQILGYFPLTAAQATIGNRFRMYGKIAISTTAGTLPAAAYIGLLPTDSLATGTGVVFGIDLTGILGVTLEMLFDIQLVDNLGGDYALASFACSALSTKLVGATTSVANEGLYSTGSEIGPSAEAQNLNVVIQIPQTASSASYLVNFDLQLEEVQ